MSSFFYDSHSREDVRSQWIRHLQAQSYVEDIAGVVRTQHHDLQATLGSASAAHRQAFQQVCGTLDDGFAQLGQYLQDINLNLSDLRGEVNAMAAMIDWRLTQVIEAQRLTNELLGRIAQVLRIPDSQKQRVYFIEQGLKYLKNAILEGVASSFYTDALDAFKQAEAIEPKDFITLNRIGHIYLYSQAHLNIPLAEQYFLRSAREASAEANAGGTTASNHLAPQGLRTLVAAANPFTAAAAEAYLYAGRASYLQGKMDVAAQHAAKASSLVPDFLQAAFEQAKYLAADSQDNPAAAVLASVIDRDRYFSLKTLADRDLVEKPPVLRLLSDLQARALATARRRYTQCVQLVAPDSRAQAALASAERHLTQGSFLSALQAADLLASKYALPYNEYTAGWNAVLKRTVTPSLPLLEFIGRENQSRSQLEVAREELRPRIARQRAVERAKAGAAIGAFVAVSACATHVFVRDWGSWFATVLVCALVGGASGFSSGWSAEPPVHEQEPS